jgi:cytochrome c oxidase cbb3-type subunit IV
MHVDLIVVLRSVITVVWFVTFVGLFLWAWSSRRREDFTAASRLPFDEGDDGDDTRHEGAS